MGSSILAHRLRTTCGRHPVVASRRLRVGARSQVPGGTGHVCVLEDLGVVDARHLKAGSILEECWSQSFGERLSLSRSLSLFRP